MAEQTVSGLGQRQAHGAESLLSLRHPTQTVAQIEVLAEGCREPIPDLGSFALLNRIPDKSRSSGILITCVYRESA